METAAIIQAVEAIKSGNERYRDPRRLLAYGAQYFSQNYEDGMIAEIFRRIGTTSRTFLEIGVGDGSENNTAVLLAGGWQGCWIEANAACCESIRHRLLAMPDVAGRLRLKEAFVSPDNVNSLVAELEIGIEIDLFSLDVDLNTFHIWAALPDFRPRVIVVEYNAAFPPDTAWIHPFAPDRAWDHTQAFGASLKSYDDLAREFGYVLVGCDLTGINAFFVRKDLAADLFASPFTPENHYEPPRYHLLHRMGHTSAFFGESAVPPMRQNQPPLAE